MMTSNSNRLAAFLSGLILLVALSAAPAAERAMPLTDFGLPEPAPTVARAPAVCGNHLFEEGETCESCPADCTPSACKTDKSSARVRFGVNWEPPFGVDASSLTVVVGYRTDRLSLPGSGAAPKIRLDGAPANALVVVNDMDYAVKVVLAKSGGLEAGQLFTLEFDRCDGAAIAEPSDFSCRVTGCASAAGDVEGCTCAVAPL